MLRAANRLQAQRSRVGDKVTGPQVMFPGSEPCQYPAPTRTWRLDGLDWSIYCIGVHIARLRRLSIVVRMDGSG